MRARSGICSSFVDPGKDAWHIVAAIEPLGVDTHDMVRVLMLWLLLWLGGRVLVDWRMRGTCNAGAGAEGTELGHRTWTDEIAGGLLLCDCERSSWCQMVLLSEPLLGR